MRHVLQEFHRYKDIIFYRTLAGLKSEARQHYLGYLWFIFEPLLSTAVLYFAMSQVSGQRGPIAVLTILLGMVVWQWFEGGVMLSTGSIAGKYHVHLQVPLPKYLFPLVDIGTHTVRFTFAFSIILIVCFCFGRPPSWALLWLPLLLLVQLSFIISTALVISLTVTLLSDLRFLVQSLFRLLFFVSGVFFTAERVPANLLGWFYANPVAVFIESYRAIILQQSAPNLSHLGYTLMATAVFFTVGAILHTYFDKRLLKLINV